MLRAMRLLLSKSRKRKERNLHVREVRKILHDLGEAERIVVVRKVMWESIQTFFVMVIILFVSLPNVGLILKKII
jgi:hypothetical protein